MSSRRIPSIRFKYGDRAVINAQLGIPVTAASNIVGGSASLASAAAVSLFSSSNSGASSWASLPLKFRPRPIDEEEMESIRFGGAVNPIGWKPPAAKKGGKKK